MAIELKRIPSSETGDFEKQTLESLTDGRVARTSRGSVSPGMNRSNTDNSEAQSVAGASLEHALLEGIRSGAHSTALTAQHLEAVVSEAVAAGREDGYREGYAAGREKGLESGFSEGHIKGRALAKREVQRLVEMIEQLMEPLDAQQTELNDALNKLVIKIAEAVVARELRAAPEIIEAVVRDAVGALPVGARNIKIRISEADKAVLEEMASSILRRDDWKIVADPELSPGDCLVEAAESLVEYLVSDRLNAVTEKLFSGGEDA